MKSIILLSYIAIALCISTDKQVVAQSPSVPTPAKQQSQRITLKGGTAHIGDGTIIQNSVVMLENGKILSIVDGNVGQPNTEGSQVIDISGKHIYPSLIAPNTNLGLTEIDAVRATRDFSEVGGLNPNVRSIIAYNTDSRITPTVRSNGVLLAQIVPRGGTVPGTSSIVELDAWNWEDAAYKMDDAVHLNWPQMNRFKGWWAQPGGIEKNKKYEEQTLKVKDLFAEAKAYCQQPKRDKVNLKLQAMCQLFSGEMSLYVHTHFIKEIIEVVNFAKEMGIKIVIVGGRDSWLATDILKENNVPVIITKTHRLPARSDEDIDIRFRLPSLLHKAGVNYCIAMGGDGWDVRNLPFQAGTAAAHGLTKEAALMAITSNTAKILGIDKSVGTLEVGKDATLVVSKGDLLDMRSSHVEYAFIRGRQIDLDNKQKALYRKFMGKYNLKAKE